MILNLPGTLSQVKEYLVLYDFLRKNKNFAELAEIRYVQELNQLDKQLEDDLITLEKYNDNIIDD